MLTVYGLDPVHEEAAVCLFFTYCTYAKWI